MSRNNKKIEIDLDRVSRRKLLGLTSAGLAAGMAGCLSGDGDDETPTDTPGNGDDDTPTDTPGNGDDDTPTDTPTQEPLGPEDLRDRTIDTMDANTPEEVNMNRFALNTGYHYIVREYFALTTNSMTEPFWVIYEDDGTYYDPDSATFHYKVKEDEYYWANGDPITAETFWRETMVGQLQNPEDQRPEEITLHDDWHWSLTYEDAANPLTLAPTSGRLAANPGYEQEWLERLQDVSNDDEREEVSADIVNTRISMQEFIDEGMSSSVWAPVEFDERSVTFEKNENHPWADEFVYDELVAHTCDGAACDEMIIDDRIDVGQNRFPEEIRGPSPDHLQTVTESRGPTSRNLYFRYLNDHMANRWVRRAMLTVLDLNFLVDFYGGEGGFVKQNQSGMSTSSEARFLDQDFIDSLYDYPLEGDEELASEFMREGGYELNSNDLWVNDDGETVDFEFAPPAGSMYETLAEAMNDVWQGFGLEPSYTPRDFGYLTPNLQDGTGDIDVTLWATGWARGVPQDYFSPENPFFLHLYTPGTNDYESWLEEGLEESPNNGRPIVVEIPEDPSDIYLEGSTKEINLLELWDEFTSIRDEERALEIIRDFATYFNYDLPRPDLFPQINALWGDTRDFDWAEDSDFYHAVTNQSMHLVHRFGAMQGVAEE